jgi:predicted RNA-binding Zn-ribbon protein involved in translation (DUF1610 family)
VSEIIDLSKDDPDITVICFDCPNAIEPEMEWINADPEEHTHKFKCPKCANTILIWKDDRKGGEATE